MQKFNPAVKANAFFTRAIMSFVFLTISVFSFAEDKKVDVDIDVNKGGGFFSTPMGMGSGCSCIYFITRCLTKRKQEGRLALN